MPNSSVPMHIDDVSRRMEEWLRVTVSDADIAFVSHFRGVDQEAEVGVAGARSWVEICFQFIADEKPDRVSLNRDDAFLLTYLLSWLQ